MNIWQPAREYTPPSNPPEPVHTIVLPLPVMNTLVKPPCACSCCLSSSSAGSLRRGWGAAQWLARTRPPDTHRAPVKGGLLQVVDAQLLHGALAAQPL